jgi:AcrR family transcriptional regulator
MVDTAMAPTARRRRAKRAPRRGRDPEATREALLASGTALFAECGFDGTSVDAIARKAGVNKAMINYHFGGKRKLYLAIFASTFAEIVERVDGLRQASRPPAELLREFVAIFADMAVRRRPNFPAMLLREVLAGGRLVEAEILPRILAIFTVVREIVERGVREGSFRPVDPVLTHLSLIGSLAFFFATAPFRDRAIAAGRLPLSPPAAEAYVRHVQELMTRGLAAEAAEGAG